jgi:hypothetical protein
MRERVRSVTALLSANSGQRIGDEHSIQFQFARNFQPSLFNRPELFLVFPREGLLLPLKPDATPLRVVVRLHNPPPGVCVSVCVCVCMCVCVYVCVYVCVCV